MGSAVLSENVEGPFAKTPFEALKRVARERKAAVDTIGEIVSALEAHEAEPDGALSREQGLAELDVLSAQLCSLERKLATASAAEEGDARKCAARLAHLAAIGPPRAGESLAWNRGRLDRLLVDHMLRSGFHASADALADAAGASELVDSHIFKGASKVVEALQAHDCGPALAWCADNRTRLKKAKSKLQFELHVREFLEMVRREEMLPAVAYARAHLAPWAGEHMKSLQRALAALVFRATTTCPPYAELFEESQWARLVDLFYQDLFKLNCLTPQPLLAIHLQAGLSALKSAPAAAPERPSREDPLSLSTFAALAAPLPCAKHHHTKLVCAVTGGSMGDANPPMALPNGYVYSAAGVDAITRKGRVTCPITGAECDAADVRRAYIM